MYEDLIAALRDMSKMGMKYGMAVVKMREAADAIEELQKRVPKAPHGRCVDADKLMQEMRLFIKENMLSRDDARELLETIEDAPTVLEADEGE